MRTDIPASFQDSFRKISAHLHAYQERYQWFTYGETLNDVFTSFAQYAGPDTVGTSVHQYGLKTGDANVYYTALPLDPAQGGRPAFSSIGSFISGTPTSESHRALSACNGAVFGALNGVVYLGPFASPTQLANLVDATTGAVPLIQLQAITPTLVVVAAVYSGASVYDHCKILVIENGAVDTWPGFLPKHSTRPSLAAIQDSSGTVHIYVDDWSGKKPVYLQRLSAGSWSATREVLPTDGLDEESSFRIGYAAYVSGAGSPLILTGVLKRRYGPSYSVYMLGPDDFTFGRDLIVEASASSAVEPYLICHGTGFIYAAGISKVYRASYTKGLLGGTVVPEEIDVARFTMEMRANGPGSLSLEIPAGEFAAHAQSLVPGAWLEVEAQANDSPTVLGEFGIDRVRSVVNTEGTRYSVDCSSRWVKKLGDWESDTFFDYLGQGESYGDPGELTKLVRYSGASYETPAGGGLRLTSLNDDGILYTTVPASSGGTMLAKFVDIPDDYVMLGVGLNYGEETLAEAAARLGKSIEEVTSAERGRWFLAAIYTTGTYADSFTPTVRLVDYNSLRKGASGEPAPYRVIAEANDTEGYEYDLMLGLEYQDGIARVYRLFVPAGYNIPYMYGTLMIEASTQLDWEIHPTEHENRGRGILFMRNNTGMHMGYAMQSGTEVVGLYSTADRDLHFGKLLEDTSDRFVLPGGVAQIDSEKIAFAGVSYSGVTADLEWVPGKIMTGNADGRTTPAGTNTTFASNAGSGTPHVHGDSYLAQSFTFLAGDTLLAVRVWLGKTNSPVDGVTLKICQGDLTYAAGARAMLANVKANGGTIPASQIPEAGGWVTFYLDRELAAAPVSGQYYWLVLSRSFNPEGVANGTSYLYKRMTDSLYPDNGAYVLCPSEWAAVGQGGDIAFAAYTRPQQLLNTGGYNFENPFCVVYQSGAGLPAFADTEYWDSPGDPSSRQETFRNCALVTTSGTGKNNTYKITYSYRDTDSRNDIFVFHLTTNPGKIFAADTRARPVAALYGLARGYDGTIAVAHGDKSKVSLVTGSPAKATAFEYFTANEDLTLAEVVKRIARKAGVWQIDLANRFTGSVEQVVNLYNARPLTTAGRAVENFVPAISKNMIVLLTLPQALATGHWISVSYFDQLGHEVMAVDISASHTGATGIVAVRVWTWTENGGVWTSTAKTIESHGIALSAKGQVRVSLYNGRFSVWCNGTLVFARQMGDDLKTWASWSVFKALDVSVGVLCPQAGMRVDNFAMDMGKSGAALIQTLIGEKRVYYRDDPLKGLAVYMDRETVGGNYSRAIDYAVEKTDVGLATRVMLEGGEVVEVADSTQLNQRGNFFKSMNFNEINNLDDAQYFAGVVLEDMVLNREKIEFSGAADPRIQPTDTMVLRLPDFLIYLVVVDTVGYEMYTDEQEAVLDMRLGGRVLG